LASEPADYVAPREELRLAEVACYFHPRWQYAVDRCRLASPPLRELRPNHHVARHHAEELTLAGVP